MGREESNLRTIAITLVVLVVIFLGYQLTIRWLDHCRHRHWLDEPSVEEEIR